MTESLDCSRARAVILEMESPIAQRFAFAKYVLGEDNLTAAAIAGRFQDERMDAAEYDLIAGRWSA